MIGHEGQTVRSLQSDTGCIIQFVTEPVIGIPNFRRSVGEVANGWYEIISILDAALQDAGRTWPEQ